MIKEMKETGLSKRKLKALQTRKKIIESVKELCQEKETDKITIEDITTRAEIAKGTFYIYFKRKEDAISEVLYESFEEIIDSINFSEANVYLQLKEFLVKSVDLIFDNTLPIAQNWMKYSVAPLPGEELGLKKYHFDLDFIKSCLNQAQKRGELKKETPVEQLSQEIICQYYGIISIWCLTNGKLSPIEQIEFYCENSLKLIIEEYSI